ncbi:TetR family transcriptional regulator [Actinomadura montaniterrae]|uniref:TetR family transcriptional regulator n=1 Tax=Actinomadura montaniterrae TaxID=1803903 RepID=UPI001CEF65DD|nr:TetR family transcriptional regulator [Actinomadura montaniterrae]
MQILTRCSTASQRLASGLSMRPVVQTLGQSTHVLTHHFAGKDALLERLDDVQARAVADH